MRSKLEDLGEDLSVSKKISSSKLYKRRVKGVIVSLIASQLTTQLNQPEDVIVHQHGDDHDMYMIARGECIVNIKDEKGRMIKDYKTLGVAEYFGEISLIYGCKRTATVISRKYTTLAKFSRSKFD